MVLSEDEKLVFDLLKNQNPCGLNELKDRAALSNKKWDKAIKGLTTKKQAQVTKDDNGLWVSML